MWFFVKKDAHIKLGLYDTNFKYSSDRDFIYRLLKSNFKGIGSRKYEIFGRFNPNGISNKLSYIQHLNESFRVRLKNQNLLIVLLGFLLTISNKIINLIFKEDNYENSIFNVINCFCPDLGDQVQAHNLANVMNDKKYKADVILLNKTNIKYKI